MLLVLICLPAQVALGIVLIPERQLLGAALTHTLPAVPGARLLIELALGSSWPMGWHSGSHEA